MCALPDKKIQRSQNVCYVALAKVLAQASETQAPVTIVVNQASAIDDHTDKKLVMPTQNAVESG